MFPNPQNKIYRYVLFGLALAFYLAGFIWSEPNAVFSLSFVAVSTLQTLLFASLLLFLTLLKRYWTGKTLIALLLVALSLNFFVSAASYWVYSARFSLGMALSVFDSTTTEVGSMAKMFLLPGFLAALFASILRRYIFNPGTKPPGRKFVIVSTVWLILPLILVIQNPNTLPHTGNVFYHANAFQKALKMNRSFKNFVPQPTEYSFPAEKPGVETIVVVIGESMRSQNMSLYGYPVATTPKMHSKQEEMSVFNHVYSAAAITNMSVPLILSSAALEDLTGNPAKLSDNILTLATHYGYRTAWLSSTHGTSESVKVLADFASKQVFTKSTDESLLAPLQKFLAEDGKKLIVLQINGSHPNPCDRYPDSWKDFRVDPELDCYNNSLRFTDYLFGEITGLLQNRNAALILTSDHGVKIRGDKYLHTDSKESTRVPYFIWFSPTVDSTFKLNLPKQKRMQNTVLYPHVAWLMGLGKIPYPKPFSGQYLNLNFEVIPLITE